MLWPLACDSACLFLEVDAHVVCMALAVRFSWLAIAHVSTVKVDAHHGRNCVCMAVAIGVSLLV